MYLLDDLNGLGLNLSTKERNRIQAEEMERAKWDIDSEKSSESGSVHNEVMYNDVLKPRSASALRLRFYSMVTPDADDPKESFAVHSATLSGRSLVA